MVEKELKVKGISYMLLALNAYAGLGVEVIYAFLLEPKIYGKQMNEWNVSQSHNTLDNYLHHMGGYNLYHS